MNRRFVVIVACASLIGLLASYLAYRVVSQVAAAGDERHEKIIVATATMGLAETVTRSHVKLVAWPKASVPPGAIRRIEDAEGRVVRGSILAGEPLIEGKLAPQLSGKGGIMPMLVPEGQRGVTIKVDDAIRESGFILPNSRVDLLASMVRGHNSSEKVAKVILQDITVLAAGQSVEIRDNKPVTVTTVTLALTPEQSERLAVAQAEGKLMLVTRNLRDNRVVQTPGATLKNLMGEAVNPPPRQTVAARPAPVGAVSAQTPAPQPRSIWVQRGDKVTEQLFFPDQDQTWIEVKPEREAGKK